MSDQANTLRQLMKSRHGMFQGMTQESIAIPVPVLTSFAIGDLEETAVLSARLGMTLAEIGTKLLFLDISGSQSLEHFHDSSKNFRIISENPAEFSDPEQVLKFFDNNPFKVERVVVNMGIGITENTVLFHRPSFQTLLILSEDSSLLPRSFGVIRRLREDHWVTRMGVIVNHMTDQQAALQVFNQLNHIVTRFLDVQLDYLGYWPFHESKNLVKSYTGMPVVSAAEKLARRLDSWWRKI